MWSKPVQDGMHALLVVNTGTRGAIDVSINLDESLAIKCAPCTLRDVWSRSALPPVRDEWWNVGIVGSHDSVFITLTH